MKLYSIFVKFDSLYFLHFAESFNWTVQTDNPILVTKGEDKTLIWEFTLTAEEQTKNDIFHFVSWRKFNQSSLEYDLVSTKTFVKAVGSTTYDEPLAPRIIIERNSQATLLISNVRKEDEGTYKIEYGVELDGTLLAYQEFNVSVLGKVLCVRGFCSFTLVHQVGQLGSFSLKMMKELSSLKIAS